MVERFRVVTSSIRLGYRVRRATDGTWQLGAAGRNASLGMGENLEDVGVEALATEYVAAGKKTWVLEEI